MTLFDGITARVLHTPRLAVGLLERDGDDPETTASRTIVFLHDLLGSSEFWQVAMLALPPDLRLIAIDLRGYGRSAAKPVDAATGVTEFAEDVAAALQALEIERPHLVGWGLGGAVAMQFARTHQVRSLTLQAPISPYGFGGTTAEGTRLTDDDAGTGAGVVPAELLERVLADDESATSPWSPRSVFRTLFLGRGYASKNEDVWVDAMLSTAIGDEHFPGDIALSDHWPGFAPGRSGVLNALAPQHLDLSGFADLVLKPPVLWVHGDQDQLISDTSLLDSNHLGSIGRLQGWPGEAVAPAQPMVSQTRAVLDAYAAAGGDVIEVVLDGVGHAPHLEEPEDFRAALLHRIGYVREYGPPTETIVLRSTD